MIGLNTTYKDISILENPYSQDSFNDSSEELSMDESLLKKLNDIVNANLKNEQFSVEDLADEVALSRSHLHRRLRALTGQSISQYIRKIRLNHSLDLLKKEVGTVSEIAFRVGFGSSTYFIKCFSEEYGYSPGEIKKRNEDFPQETEDANLKETPHQESINQPVKKYPVEMFHPISSESMIREIFESLVIQKPSLEKFISVDEEEGDQIDNRLLAYQIFKNFPWAIGVEIRRLFSVSLNATTERRYLQLKRTTSRIVKLLTILSISELVEKINSKEIELNKKDKSKMGQLLSGFKNADQIAILELTNSIFKNGNHDYYIDELKSVFDQAFSREMKDWLQIIETIPNGKESLEESSSALEQIMILLLKKCSFLIKYKMVNVGSIKVIKSRFKSALFEHNLLILNNSDSDFHLHKETLEKFSDSNAVLLVKSVKKPNHFLNLSPFVIDTHGNENIQKQNVKKDIFILDDFEDVKLVYSGCELLNSHDLSSLENYPDLLKEYQEILKVVCR
ncbi:MAG: helix-turn-helix transcriptional regulator [Reichenbachiella sp.]